MSIHIKSISVAALMLTLLLAACGGTDSPKKQVDIESLGWVIENRDPSLSSSNVSARLLTYIYLADTGLMTSDFASIEITAPNDKEVSWFFDSTAEFGDNFDAENSSFQFNLVDSNRGNGSVFSLGNYVVTVKLKNGDAATQTLFVPAPGSTSTNGYEFAYTEDYSGAANPPSNYVALPKRATITSTTLDLQASTLEVNFSVEDEAVYDGWLRVYDEAGDHIGSSSFFRDYDTGELMEQLNEGRTLLTDGEANTLSLAASSEQLNFFGTSTLADIASVSVILTDGKQYVDTEGRYDTRSRTEKFNVAVIE